MTSIVCRFENTNLFGRLYKEEDKFGSVSPGNQRKRRERKRKKVGLKNNKIFVIKFFFLIFCNKKIK